MPFGVFHTCNGVLPFDAMPSKSSSRPAFWVSFLCVTERFVAHAIEMAAGAICWAFTDTWPLHTMVLREEERP